MTLNGAVKAILNGATVKIEVLEAVFAPTVTETGPVVAPVGTIAVILVAELVVTIAEVPLNMTRLLAGVVSKFVPMMVTVVPMGPLTGAKDVIVGACAMAPRYFLKPDLGLADYSYRAAKPFD